MSKARRERLQLRRQISRPIDARVDIEGDAADARVALEIGLANFLDQSPSIAVLLAPPLGSDGPIDACHSPAPPPIRQILLNPFQDRQYPARAPGPAKCDRRAT